MIFNNNIKISKIRPKTKFVAKNIVYLKIIDSTNMAARNSKCENGTLFIAEEQINGRGRMGKEWISQKKNGIWMSIALMPKIDAQYINRITLVTGLAVCETLTELYKLPFKIKWPNDIVAGGKKVCGILVEGVSEKGKVTKVINGIGINVNNKGFPKEIENTATSLRLLTSKKIQREEIINKLCEIFEKYYTQLLTDDTDNIIERYTKNCITIGREIAAIKANETIKGTAVGITNTGELIVKKEDGTTLNINSGEVSVRGIYGYI